MNVLQLTVHFSPNIGGVETHLNDLCAGLIKRDYKVTVLTYRPLETDTFWRLDERRKGLEIIRLPWIRGLFNEFIRFPLLEFFYLFPGLFIAAPFIINFKKIDVIHAHGIIAGLIGVFWGKILRKRIVISTHSIYGFPEKGFYRNFAFWIFNNAAFCLTLSEQSKKELKGLGISNKKIAKFTYWIDLLNFRKIKNAKIILKWSSFNILFVGRLVVEKGIEELLKSVTKWDKSIILNIVGSGPLENKIRLYAKKNCNVRFLGSISQDKLPLYYNAADLLVVPSLSEEGFGRVILESLACGTPVVAAKKEGISEAMDETVGKLIDINSEGITREVNALFKNRAVLRKLADESRGFAERRYSEKNVEEIIKTYSK